MNTQEVQHTEQKVLFIPESDLNLEDGYFIVSTAFGFAKEADEQNRAIPGLKVTIRKIH